MSFLGLSLSPTYEVALYTFLLLFLWLLIRLFASRLNRWLAYFGDSTMIVEPFLNEVSNPVSYWTEKGGRPYQEDRFQVLKSSVSETNFYGVFDGHGGFHASQHCKEHLLQSVGTDPEWLADPQQALSRAFLRSPIFLLFFVKTVDRPVIQC